jgi:DNA-binding helix-hairpin-helix protein with protein kinase domain
MVVVELVKWVVGLVVAAIPYLLVGAALVAAIFWRKELAKMWKSVLAFFRSGSVHPPTSSPTQTTPSPATPVQRRVPRPQPPSGTVTPRATIVQTSPPTVYDVNGEAKNLGKRIGKGGEGEVWTLAGREDRLVKLYHPRVLRRLGHDHELQDKLTLMRGMKALVDDNRFAWPRMLVFDAQHQWCGYGMRRVLGVSFQTLCQPQLVRERLKDWDRRMQVTAALNFLEVVRTLHRNDVIIGDINPGNFLVNPSDAGVSAVDCDSYQVRNCGRTFTCPVGIPMYLAPELLDANLQSTERTTEQELFSVAIMLFPALIHGLGNHVGLARVTSEKALRAPLARIAS